MALDYVSALWIRYSQKSHAIMSRTQNWICMQHYIGYLITHVKGIFHRAHMRGSCTALTVCRYIVKYIEYISMAFQPSP